jgi:hypothetical protein
MKSFKAVLLLATAALALSTSIAVTAAGAPPQQ